MSFFAGKLEGETVLSLRTENGGDLNQHITPDARTIFHSSMPHLFITGEYAATLGSAGSNYYVCAMPNDIVSIVSNDPGRLVLVKVDFRKADGSEYSRILNGTSLGVGTHYSWRTDVTITDPNTVMPDGATETNESLCGRTWFQTSIDSVLDAGYYTYSSGMGHVGSIGRSGTGRGLSIKYTALGNYYISRSDIDHIIGFAENFAAQQAYKNASHAGNKRADPYNMPASGRRSINLSTIGSVFGAGSAATWFYISKNSAPTYVRSTNMWWAGQDTTGPNTVTYQDIPVTSNWMLNMGYNTSFYQQSYARFKYDATSPYTFPTTNTDTPYIVSVSDLNYATLADTPIRVTWLVTNTVYDYNAGTFKSTSPFTGSEIKLSPKDFTIKGINMMTYPDKMISYLNYTYTNRLDLRPIGCNITRDVVTTSPSSSLPNMGVLSTGGITSTTLSGRTLIPGCSMAALGIIDWQPTSEWKVDTRVPSIGNQYGEVWGPSSNPLKLFKGNVASVTLSSSIITQTNNAPTRLAVAELGLAAGDAAVIMNLHFLDGSLYSSGGFGSYNPVTKWSGTGPVPATTDSSLNVTNMPANTGRTNIILLPNGKYTPILTYNIGGRTDDSTIYGFYYENFSGLPSSGTTYRQTVSIWARKNGSTIEFWANTATQSNSMLGKVRMPNVKITVQKLA